MSAPISGTRNFHMIEAFPERFEGAPRWPPTSHGRVAPLRLRMNSRRSAKRCGRLRRRLQKSARDDGYADWLAAQRIFSGRRLQTVR